MKVTYAILIICSVLNIGCNDYFCNCEDDVFIARLNDSIVSEVLLLEEGPFSRTLKHYNEDNLLEQKNESYRFIYTAPFDKFQKIYKVTKEKHDISFYVKTFISDFDSLGNNNQRISRNSKSISEKEWKNLKKTIADNCFWNLLVYDNRRGLDGSNWLLEGFNPNYDACQKRSYHFIFRWAPDSSSQSLVNICDRFKDLDSFE